MATTIAPLDSEALRPPGSAACPQRGEAFVCMVQPVASDLYRRACRLMRNPADAEDVSQETLLRAFARLEQFAGGETCPRAFHGWLLHIATNYSIDRIRQRRPNMFLSIDAAVSSEEGSFADRLVSPCEDPEQNYGRQELRRLLADAIEQLQPRLRAVCLLRDVLHYSTEETANRLGISRTAVRLRLFRAHRQLREQLRSLTQRDVSAHMTKRQPGRVVATVCALPSCACGD